jgi:glycine dehydrogenase subunit 2
MTEPTIYEMSRPGRTGVRFPAADVPISPFPEGLVRSDLPLPEVAEVDVVRHFTRLSRLNYGIDLGMYPLGSCTMKYNPRVNEAVARLPGFAYTHPLQPEETIQGNLVLMYELQEWLKEIAGFTAVSLQPAAGAHGELTGIMIIRAYHLSRGDHKRTKVLIPDSAHGTNPATSAMAGFQVVPVPSDSSGDVDLEILRSLCDDTVAGIMVTNPNTLGLFEKNILEVTQLVHQAGGLVYGDGANMNALLGVARPGDLGIDVMHFNLHKTFSTPHGGGGPGSGPVGVSSALIDFLPGPIAVIKEEGSGDFPPLYGLAMPARSIGRVKSFFGHFGMWVRAYTYIAMHGPEGLRQIAENAVLNANYLRVRLQETYHLAYDRTCMHECVFEGHWEDAPDIHALDIAKRLMDYDFHPPTNYFPLIVHEALMIEPTETESRESLDAFVEALLKIAGEAHSQPELLKEAPHNTPIRRVDEIKAAKELVLCCWIPDKI